MKRDPVSITPIPYNEDNYAYLVSIEDEQILFDCGNGSTICNRLNEMKATPSKLFLTHNDHDHIDGLPLFRELFPHCEIITPELALEDVFDEIAVIHTPGHCMEHVCYHIPSQEILITGDTLFAGGSGRCKTKRFDLFTVSLFALSLLPPKTKLYGAHEYLQPNVMYLKSIGFHTAYYEKRLTKPFPSCGLSIENELIHNAFFKAGAERNTKLFTRLRTDKDHFRG